MPVGAGQMQRGVAVVVLHLRAGLVVQQQQLRGEKTAAELHEEQGAPQHPQVRPGLGSWSDLRHYMGCILLALNPKYYFLSFF